MFRRKGRDYRSDAALAVHKGKYDKALDCYLSLEKQEPGEAEWSRKVAQMYERLGRNEEAVSALERAIAKYRQAGFEAKANAVRALIQRLDPSYATLPPATTSAEPAAVSARKRRRLAVGTERMAPPAAGVQVAWAYHQEISKDERVALALSDLAPEEAAANATPPTGSASRPKR